MEAPAGHDRNADQIAYWNGPGGKRWTEAEAATQLAAGHQCLADTDMPSTVRAEFAGIAEFITARQW